MNQWPVRYIARVVSSNGVVRITAISEASSTATPLPKESRDSFVEVASSCIQYIVSSLFHLNSVFVHRGEEENGLLWRRWTDFDKSVISCWTNFEIYYKFQKDIFETDIKSTFFFLISKREIISSLDPSTGIYNYAFDR